MPIPTETRKAALEATRSLLADKSTYKAAGEFLDLNPAHIWQADNNSYVTPMLAKTLAKRGLIKTPAAWKPRRRVWMRTDDVEKAVEMLCRHYDRSEIMMAVIKRLDIISVEYYTPARDDYGTDQG